MHHHICFPGTFLLKTRVCDPVKDILEKNMEAIQLKLMDSDGMVI